MGKRQRRKYMREHQRRYRKKNKKLLQAVGRAYYQKNRDKLRKRAIKYYYKHKTRRKRSFIYRKYGITYSDLSKLKREVGYKCGICHKKGRLCVDHDHKTGAVRGILCDMCNVGLGTFKDDIQLLKRAVKWLEKATLTEK